MKRASVFLTAALMLAAFGCGGGKDSGSTEADGIITISDNSGLAASAPNRAEANGWTAKGFTGATLASQSEEEPIISIVKMPADFRAEYHFFADDQTNETILFLATESVENFAYIDIVPAYNGDDLVLLVGELRFGLDVFTPEKPFVVSVNIGSGIPAKGIHFEYKGKVWFFYITESGMDGSLQLVEFTPFFG